MLAARVPIHSPLGRTERGLDALHFNSSSCGREGMGRLNFRFYKLAVSSDRTAEPPSMLKLEHIYKSFEGRTVLSDVSLSIPQGATHALIGSSGSGKTTLLRLTLGLIPFDRGYVKINDQALLSFTPTEWADRIGYVPQDGGLFPHISGRQNVALVPGLRNWPADRIASRV